MLGQHFGFTALHIAGQLHDKAADRHPRGGIHVDIGADHLTANIVQIVLLGQLFHQVVQRWGVEHGFRAAGAVAQPVLVDVKNTADRKNVLIRDLAQTFFEFAYRRFANT